MSLRVQAPGIGQPRTNEDSDGWASRLAKLIPAEALGLYGATVGLVPPLEDNKTVRLVCLIVIAVLCLAVAIVVRWKSTSRATGSPQVWAIIISAVSFVIWVATLGANSPIPLPASVGFLPSVVAALWTGAIAYFYRGDAE